MQSKSTKVRFKTYQNATRKVLLLGVCWGFESAMMQRAMKILSSSFDTTIVENSLEERYLYYEIKNRSTHICRIKGCGGAGWPPPPIIFERLKLPQQIIYRRKENLSESPNHQKYWENILVSRFYKQFSRNRRNLGHFRKFEKISNS